MENLYNRLFKYKPEKELSSSENFITESFVYILDFSLKHSTEFLLHFFQRLGITINKQDYHKIFIDTQRQFETIYNLKAIPDICIQIDSNLFIFEVKYDSGINEYQLPDNPIITINQIDKYQGIITNPKLILHIFTIVIHSSNIDFKKSNPDFKDEILWHEIYNSIRIYHSDNHIENYLHNEITKFMEDNKMAIPKVSYELQNGMQALLNLYDQIEIVLEKLKIPYNSSFGYNWTGYYLFRDSSKNDKYYGWIGTYWEVDKLTFIFSDPKAQEKISQEKRENEFERQVDTKIFCKYFIYENEHYFCLSAQEQLDKLSDWIGQNYDLLKLLSK